VVYHQPAYKRLGLTGNCPISERIASEISNGTYREKKDG
jgi:hypothetical protein